MTLAVLGLVDVSLDDDTPVEELRPSTPRHGSKGGLSEKTAQLQTITRVCALNLSEKALSLITATTTGQFDEAIAKFAVEGVKNNPSFKEIMLNDKEITNLLTAVIQDAFKHVRKQNPVLIMPPVTLIGPVASKAWANAHGTGGCCVLL